MRAARFGERLVAPEPLRHLFRRLHVAVGMSGGVDSTIAAHLLKSEGHCVTGVFMRNWDAQDETGVCGADEDLNYAKTAASALGVELKEVNFTKEYWNHVFSYVVDDYENGRTPNPDIVCNELIKFRTFLNYTSNVLGLDALATGHYARTSAGRRLELLKGLDAAGEPVRLLRGVDLIKDQSFFLSRISQSALRRVIFPVGNLTKREVKQLAIDIGLGKFASKRESMGICFIGSRRFQKFIDGYIAPTPGNFIHVENGKVIGTHSGIHQWTIGQRIGLGGQRKAFFVAKRNVDTNDILVAPGTHHPSLFSCTMEVEAPHWIAGDPHLYVDDDGDDVDFSKLGFRFQHNNQGLVDPCALSRRNGRFFVRLKEPTRALTPGQFATFYRGEECLGSARILAPGATLWDLQEAEKSVHVNSNSG